jgi:hypothetical protein
MDGLRGEQKEVAILEMRVDVATRSEHDGEVELMKTLTRYSCYLG